jgi:hypothetical protein
MLHAASAPAQSARHPHRKMAAQRLMKATDVAVKETANGRMALSRDRMIGYEDLITLRSRVPLWPRRNAETRPVTSCGIVSTMADTWFSPEHRRPLSTGHPGEPLWTLERSGRKVACELRDHGESAGVEVQLLRNGEFYAGRRFETRAVALQHADHVRESLERDGWRVEFPVDRR